MTKLFHFYVLDSDFNNILSTNTNPTVENAISATYQSANLDANYKNGGVINSYRKNFSPSVPVYMDGKLIANINEFTIANYSVNATYEGSFKALYFGCGIGQSCSAILPEGNEYFVEPKEKFNPNGGIYDIYDLKGNIRVKEANFFYYNLYGLYVFRLDCGGSSYTINSLGTKVTFTISINFP